MSMTVRPENQGDKQKCLEFISTLRQEIIQDNWAETYDSLIKGDRGTLLVAGDDKFGVLGMATISFNLAIRTAVNIASSKNFLSIQQRAARMLAAC
jgi:hypothetical protein